jgi:hypothetical protein
VERRSSQILPSAFPNDLMQGACAVRIDDLLDGMIAQIGLARICCGIESQPLVSLRHYIHGRNAGRNLQPIEIGVAGAAVPTSDYDGSEFVAGPICGSLAAFAVPKQHEFVHADVGQSWELRKGATDFLEAGRIANSAIIWRSPTRPSPTKPLLKTPLIVPSAPSTNPPQAAAGQPENP